MSAPKAPVAGRDLASADRHGRCLLFVTPEYNYSIPGVLKMRSTGRPSADQPFAGKPALAIMGAGAGMAGTARAQYDLRRCCVFLDMHPLQQARVLIGQARPNRRRGPLTDEAARGSSAICSSHIDQWTRLIGRKA